MTTPWLPALFVNGDFDRICSSNANRQGEPMRAACRNLTLASMSCRHWLPLERKDELVQVIGCWLQNKKL